MPPPISFFAGFGLIGAILEILRFAWPYIKGACAVIISFGGLLAAILSIFGDWSDMPGAMNALASNMDATAAMLRGMPSHAVLSRVNVIFPLTELLGFVSAYVALFVACTVMRWLKSVLLFWSGG